MKSCAHCNLYFNDGQVCPQCGGQLTDYYPQQQQQNAAYYQQQAGAYQNPQQSTAAAQQPIQVIKKRTGLVIFLLILVLALAAALGFMIFQSSQQESGPDPLDQAVLDSAWSWYTEVYDLTAQASIYYTTTTNARAAAETGAPLEDIQDGFALNPPEVLGTLDSFTKVVDGMMPTTDKEDVYLGALAALSGPESAEAISGPMLIINDEYPDVAIAWFDLQDQCVSNYNDLLQRRANMTKMQSAANKFKSAVENAGFDTSQWVTPSK